MWLPSLTAKIDRRILLNVRVRPEYWATNQLLPDRLQPVVHNGWTIAGVCLIKLSNVRARGFPQWCGLSTEGAAVRVACVDTNNNNQRCVAIIQRYANSRLIQSTDAITPMRHELARITSRDQQERHEVEIHLANEQKAMVAVSASHEWPTDSVFSSLEDASAFFEEEAFGHTVTSDACCVGGVRLAVPDWRVSPARIERAEFPWLPEGQFELDHALLMRNATSNWEWFRR